MDLVHTGSSFEHPAFQVLSAIVHLLGASILTHCLSRRILVERLSTLKSIRQITFARCIIILVFLDSWLFLFTSGMLLMGIGLDRDSAVCSAAYHLCIVFYGTSKFLIYIFLAEKVHVVWGPLLGVDRRHSSVYLVCMAVITTYFGIVAVMFIGHIDILREDGECIMGPKKFASIPLLVYDLLINLLLTSLFVWPLVGTSIASPLLRAIARRTLIASLIVLSTSTGNVLMYLLPAHVQPGWVCLTACAVDIVTSALALFWVTSGHVPPEDTPPGSKIEFRVRPSVSSDEVWTTATMEPRGAGQAEVVECGKPYAPPIDGAARTEQAF